MKTSTIQERMLEAMTPFFVEMEKEERSRRIKMEIKRRKDEKNKKDL